MPERAEAGPTRDEGRAAACGSLQALSSCRVTSRASAPTRLKFLQAVQGLFGTSFKVWDFSDWLFSVIQTPKAAMPWLSRRPSKHLSSCALIKARKLAKSLA